MAQQGRKRTSPAKARSRQSSESEGPYIWPHMCAMSVENFKAIRSREHLEIRPLTLVTGENSSGKSSLLQALILLKQSLEDPARGSELAFDGLVDLGSFARVLSDGANGDEGFTIALEFGVGVHRDELRESYGVHARRAEISLTFCLEDTGQPTAGPPHLRGFEMVLIDDKGTRHDWLTFESSDGRDFSITSFSRRAAARIRQAAKGSPFRLPKISELSVRFERLCPGYVNVDAVGSSTTGGRAKYTLPIAMFLPTVGALARLFVGECTDSLHYLGPLRVEPKRIYQRSARSMGIHGENSMPYLYANARQHVEDGAPPGRRTQTLLGCVEAWLDHLGLTRSLTFASRGDLYVEVMADGRHLPELGCGVGQVLPVLVRCLAAGRYSTVLLEQPELHLHQSLQALLCDFLIAQSRRGLRIIVETHSEIMIQRLRTRIAEESDGFVRAHSAVYFMSKSGDGLQEIEIDNYGNVKSWPESFFDQGLKEVRALSVAQAKRDQK